MNQKGSTLALALVFVLVSAIILTALFNNSQIFDNSQTRYLKKKQALYLAEAGLQLQIFDLKRPKPLSLKNANEDSTTFINSEELLVEERKVWNRFYLADYKIPEYSIDSNGYWYTVFSTGNFKNQTAAIAVMLGKRLNQAIFAPALRLQSTQLPMGVNPVNIKGPILLLKDTNTPVIEGVYPNNEHNTVLSKIEGLISAKVAGWDKEFSDFYSSEEFFDSPNLVQGSMRIGRNRIEEITQVNSLEISAGDLEIILDDEYSTTKITDKKHIYVEGDVRIEGDIYMENIFLIASGSIELRGQVHGKNLNFYSKNKITLKGDCHLSGSFTAAGDIILENNSSISNPSVLVTYGCTANETDVEGSIFLKNESRAEGFLLSFCASVAAPPDGGNQSNRFDNLSRKPGSVVIDFGTLVQGIVVARNQVYIDGDINGSVVANTLGCEGMPGESCIGQGKIDRNKLPQNIFQPPGLDFDGAEIYKPIYWQMR